MRRVADRHPKPPRLGWYPLGMPRHRLSPIARARRSARDDRRVHPPVRSRRGPPLRRDRREPAWHRARSTALFRAAHEPEILDASGAVVVENTRESETLLRVERLLVPADDTPTTSLGTGGSRRIRMARFAGRTTRSGTLRSFTTPLVVAPETSSPASCTRRNQRSPQSRQQPPDRRAAYELELVGGCPPGGTRDAHPLHARSEPGTVHGDLAYRPPAVGRRQRVVHGTPRRFAGDRACSG